MHSNIVPWKIPTGGIDDASVKNKWRWDWMDAEYEGATYFNGYKDAQRRQKIIIWKQIIYHNMPQSASQLLQIQQVQGALPLVDPARGPMQPLGPPPCHPNTNFTRKLYFANTMPVCRLNRNVCFVWLTFNKNSQKTKGRLEYIYYAPEYRTKTGFWLVQLPFTQTKSHDWSYIHVHVSHTHSLDYAMLMSINYFEKDWCTYTLQMVSLLYAKM